MRRNYNKVATQASGLGDDETEAHFRTESPTNLTSPQFIKANPGGKEPPFPVISCPHAVSHLRRKVKFETR